MMKHSNSDLVAGTIYTSSNPSHISGEVISKLLHVGNAGGFRRLRQQINGQPVKQLAYVCLFSTGQEPEWQDFLDEETGIYTYFGDNRKPGNDILNTKQKGNVFLEEVFCNLLKENRFLIPPVFIFQKTEGRDVKFQGLAVPGCAEEPPEHFLNRQKFILETGCFENYQATFTILNINRIAYKWISELQSGQGLFSPSAPPEWIRWVEDGIYLPKIKK